METGAPAYAPVVESGRLAYRDTMRRFEAESRAGRGFHAPRSERSDPAAPALAARTAIAPPDSCTEPRSGGATASAEPRPNYYWDDCVMAGLAASPHCGV